MASHKNKPFTPKQTTFLRKAYHNNPEAMTRDFSHMFTVKESRKMLWRMTCAFLGSEYSDHLNKTQRSDYMLFYEMLVALMEAGYLIEAKNNKVT
jgi:hypothetical protein